MGHSDGDRPWPRANAGPEKGHPMTSLRLCPSGRAEGGIGGGGDWFAPPHATLTGSESHDE